MKTDIAEITASVCSSSLLFLLAINGGVSIWWGLLFACFLIVNKETSWK